MIVEDCNPSRVLLGARITAEKKNFTDVVVGG